MAAIAASVLSFCIAANGEELKKTKETADLNQKKILIAYFSRTGNTREMARQIQKATGGDIFEIIPLKPYPEAYQEVVAQAKKEIKAGFKPELKTKIKDINKYDIIFVGSPNWFSTIAPPVTAFLAAYDLSGKTVIPFVTHGGGGMANCEADVKKLCPKSTFLKGQAVNGRLVKNAQDKISEWLREIKISK
jgi:flavodoxin